MLNKTKRNRILKIDEKFQKIYKIVRYSDKLDFCIMPEVVELRNLFGEMHNIAKGE